MIDQEAVKEHVRGLLVALGDDTEREGLRETPERVARMYEEIFAGMNYTNREIAEMFDKTFEDDLDFSDSESDLVIVNPHARSLGTTINETVQAIGC